MSDRAKQLLRMSEAFESAAQVHERRLLALERDKIAMETAIREIGGALDSPHVNSLPIFAAALRRIAEASESIVRMDSEMTAIRQKILVSRFRENHSRSLCALLVAGETRSAAETEALETVGMMMCSSPPQDSRA